MPNNTPPTHSSVAYFPAFGHCLRVGGVLLDRLALRVGQTPFFAYDRRALTHRMEMLRRELPSNVHIHYAVKANPMPAVVQHMASLVDGLDVASANELRIALDTPTSPRYISMAGPGKSLHDISTAIAAGAVLHIESEEEYQRILRCSDNMGITPRVAIRINPDFELKYSGMRMGGGSRPFGIDAERVPALLTSLVNQKVEFMGFHLFAGSQNLKTEALIEAQDKSVDLALKLALPISGLLPVLNIGGGFGIPYFPGEKPFDLQAIGRHLEILAMKVKVVRPETQLVIELGRYLVGEAGIYVCQIIDKKISRGKTYLVTNGGLHHHLSASGNFGQVIRKNYPVVIGTKMNSEERERVTIVGPLCTPLDILADNVELPKADIGDLVVVYQSGAYGLSASPQNFLSQPNALEVLV